MWEKIGFFSVPRNRYSWMHSHAQLPTALVLDDSRVRVFFATRTNEQRSHIAYTDLKFDSGGNNFEVQEISSRPVISPGPIGHFDEHGVFPSSIIKSDGSIYLYYIGWNQGVEAPLFYASIGLAVGVDGCTFKPVSNAPILTRSEVDPCMVTSPYVYIDNGRWRMAYVSGVKWDRNKNGRLQSYYNIKLAESENQQDWRRDGKVAIDFKGGEKNIARPSVLRCANNGYRMWYSYVDAVVGKYRMGYAESNDGTEWLRKDELVPTGLDREHCLESACYPCVFELGKHTYILYNGDNFGEAGFCVAKFI